MTDKREAIRDAEEAIEDILEDLEREYDTRTYRVYINSKRGERPQVNLIQDLEGGSL